MSVFAPLATDILRASRPASDLRILMATPDGDRTVGWLRNMLQLAISLESSTIPPYLVAMWSVIDQNDPITDLFLQILLQEMLHMGIACNLLNSIGGSVRIAYADVVPTYPGHLPGNVHPGLVVGLEPLSKDLIAKVFMTIEEPECGPIKYYLGQTYPTIGEFYSAIQDRVKLLRPDEIAPTKQLASAKLGLTPIGTVPQALAALETIKEQGEGTSSSPKYGPNPGDFAHYYVFGEMYHGKRLVEVTPGNWEYSGAAVDFPKPDGIYPMAPILATGYPESMAFNRAFTNMLQELQQAWDLGHEGGGDGHLTAAETQMGSLGDPAAQLMTTKIPGSNLTYGPCFKLV